ncbi:MAG TPA: beta-lactamase family protein [Tissierellia bacterium]|nr:beta-lactamase family protein [Tissierellia bacterium]
MIKTELEKLLSKHAKNFKTLQFGCHIPEMDIEYHYSSSDSNQLFHSASVGKLMTASLVFLAIEKGLLQLDSPISTILDRDTLDGLFVVDGQDFQDQATIRHLLGHTSGINDYFESKTIDGSSFIDDVLRDQDTLWAPSDLLDFTRSRQQAIAQPGQKFLYSDTGYILLGLVIEKVFGMPFFKALENFIFKPVDMSDSGLSFYSPGFDQSKLAPMYINGVDVHLFKSLSCDFSGGGIYTTTNDLLKFIRAFYQEDIITQASINQMASFDNRFHVGLYYGLGMMQARFKEFFFLLKHLPTLQGHIGVSGAHIWYDPISKLSLTLNVGNAKDMAKSFRLLIKIMQLLHKARKSK